MPSSIPSEGTVNPQIRASYSFPPLHYWSTFSPRKHRKLFFPLLVLENLKNAD